MIANIIDFFERLRLKCIVKQNKKFFLYNNWLWIYCHQIHDALVTHTTMHPVEIPWEFLEHHTDYEIKNVFNDEENEILDRVARMAKYSPDFDEDVKRMVKK